MFYDFLNYFIYFSFIAIISDIYYIKKYSYLGIFLICENTHTKKKRERMIKEIEKN